MVCKDPFYTEFMISGMSTVAPHIIPELILQLGEGYLSQELRFQLSDLSQHSRSSWGISLTVVEILVRW